MSASFTNVCSVGAVSTTTSELVELLGETQKAKAKGYRYTGGQRKIVRVWQAARIKLSYSRSCRRLKQRATTTQERRQQIARLHKLINIEVILRHLQAILYSLCCYGRTEKISLHPVQLSIPHCMSRCFTFSPGTWSTSGAWSWKKLNNYNHTLFLREAMSCVYICLV